MTCLLLGSACCQHAQRPCSCGGTAPKPWGRTEDLGRNAIYLLVFSFFFQASWCSLKDRTSFQHKGWFSEQRGPKVRQIKLGARVEPGAPGARGRESPGAALPGSAPASVTARLQECCWALGTGRAEQLLQRGPTGCWSRGFRTFSSFQPLHRALCAVGALSVGSPSPAPKQPSALAGSVPVIASLLALCRRDQMARFCQHLMILKPPRTIIPCS